MIRDNRLSFRALGVLVEILSRPDNWQTRSESLAAGRPEGRDAVRSALSELRAAGYLRTEKVRGERGRIYTVSTVYDEPLHWEQASDDVAYSQFAPETDRPAPDGPEAGRPDVGPPGAAFSGVFKNTDTNTGEEHLRRTPDVRNDAAPASSSSRGSAADDDDVRKKRSTPRRPRRSKREVDEQLARDILMECAPRYEPAEYQATLDLIRAQYNPRRIGAYLQGIVDQDGEDKIVDLVIQGLCRHVRSLDVA